MILECLRVALSSPFQHGPNEHLTAERIAQSLRHADGVTRMLPVLCCFKVWLMRMKRAANTETNVEE